MESSAIKIVLTSLFALFARCAPVSQSAIAIDNGTGIQQGDSPTLAHHEGYSLLYSELHEQPYWVAYTLTKDEVHGTVPRDDDFREDPSIPSGSAELLDYKGSGFDRGHLKPAADSKSSEQEMSESFFMSNMSPQKEKFNRVIWEHLEELVREYAVNHDSIFVITGPILTDPTDQIGENRVSVPRAFYKIILNADSSRSIAFLLPHQNSKKTLATFAVPVDSIESLTGFDFFTGLDESIESSCDFSAW